MSDFDGTLAPIVVDPGAAWPLAGVVPVLSRLAGALGLVGVVSGRPVGFLRDRLAGAADSLVLVGLYGLEWSERGELRADAEAQRWRPAVAEEAAAAARRAPPGVTVQDRGLTFTLHARSSPQRLAWVEDYAAAAARRSGLAAHPGRLSVELRPPVEIDKGTVAERLSAGRTAAGYLGDDRGDLPAFDALARRRGEGVATLSVAAASAEAPPELLAAADLVVDGPPGILALLAALSARTAPP